MKNLKTTPNINLQISALTTHRYKCMSNSLRMMFNKYRRIAATHDERLARNSCQAYTKAHSLNSTNAFQNKIVHQLNHKKKLRILIQIISKKNMLCKIHEEKRKKRRGCAQYIHTVKYYWSQEHRQWKVRLHTGTDFSPSMLNVHGVIWFLILIPSIKLRIYIYIWRQLTTFWMELNQTQCSINAVNVKPHQEQE